MILKRFSKTLLALLLCFIALFSAVATYAYLIYNQSGTSGEADFTFTWGPKVQRIVDGKFCLKIMLEWEGGENLTIIVKANDDEYNPGDGVGLVFDTNQNGYLDEKDEAYALDANNKTITGGFLTEYGFICLPSAIPERGPQIVTFNNKAGYTFIVKFPWADKYGEVWNPASALKRGHYLRTARNPLHVYFHDDDTGCEVFVQFDFYILEET